MKKIKTFILGFFVCFCMFLIMGHIKNNNIEKYHFAVQRGLDIGETYYLYNKENHDVKILHAYKSDEGKQEWSAIKINFKEKFEESEKATQEKIKKTKALIIGK